MRSFWSSVSMDYSLKSAVSPAVTRSPSRWGMGSRRVYVVQVSDLPSGPAVISRLRPTILLECGHYTGRIVLTLGTGDQLVRTEAGYRPGLHFLRARRTARHPNPAGTQ